jgi:hypothetical protein
MKINTGQVNRPDYLRGDDNVGNVYGVFKDGEHIGYAHHVPSSRSWVARRVDGSIPADGIDAMTLKAAASLLAEVTA